MKTNFLVCPYENKNQYEHLVCMIKDVMTEYEVETTEFFFEEKEVNALARKLTNLKDEYIFTIDMAGFQVSTFLGTHAYNMVSAKQIHLILDERKMDKYGISEVALNLYIFLDKRKTDCDSKYSHIPNLHFYRSFECDERGKIRKCSENVAIVREIIGTVMNELNAVYGNAKIS